MIAVPDPTGLKPGECAPCKAQTPPKVGYCAPNRCYCHHTACPAYASTFSLLPEREAVEPVPFEEAAERARARREAAGRIPDEIRADLKRRREAKATR